MEETGSSKSDVGRLTEGFSQIGNLSEMGKTASSHAEIAAECGCDEKTVTNVVSGISEKSPEFQKQAALHSDFDPPLYNVWKQQEKTAGARADELILVYRYPNLEGELK